MIYILMYKQPIGNLSNNRAQARTYLGYCADDRLCERVREHMSGKGARLTRAFAKQGLKPVVALCTPEQYGGTKELERVLKKKVKNNRHVLKMWQKYGMTYMERYIA